jgi:hypothetical protein
MWKFERAKENEPMGLPSSVISISISIIDDAECWCTVQCDAQNLDKALITVTT